jgi:small GTP-binding protein
MAGKRSGTEPTVVLVGRPNVGKSTLFNRITGTRRAIVTPMAGTTRDVIAHQAEWLDTTFNLVDTGGLFGASLDPLHELVVKHGQRAIQSADVIVFVVDGREGLVSGDQEIARQLRPVGVPVVLAVNKTDVKRADEQEFYQLGIEPLVGIAAEHGQGIGDLLDEVVRYLKAKPASAGRGARASREARGGGSKKTAKAASAEPLDEFDDADDADVVDDTDGVDDADGEDDAVSVGELGAVEEGEAAGGSKLVTEGATAGGIGAKVRKGQRGPGAASTSGAFRNIETRTSHDLAIAASGEAAPTAEASRRGDAPDTGEISIAIIGRPNVGKSSLVNRLLKEERVMVSPLAGTTRDPIDTVLRWRGRDLRIVDTAGIRRAGKVANAAHVEAVSVVLARRAIERADVAVLLIDAVEGPTDQDAAIAGEAERTGCGVIIVANKWDLMKGRGVNFSKEFDENLRRRLKFLDYAPVMHLSALTGERTPKLLEMIERVAKARHARVSTGALNRFVKAATDAHPPVSPERRAVRIMYASQTGVAPPTFVLFTNVATTFHFSYERFLINRLREEFEFIGTPIRLHIRKRGKT